MNNAFKVDLARFTSCAVKAFTEAQNCLECGFVPATLEETEQADRLAWIKTFGTPWPILGGEPAITEPRLRERTTTTIKSPDGMESVTVVETFE